MIIASNHPSLALSGLGPLLLLLLTALSQEAAAFLPSQPRSIGTVRNAPIPQVVPSWGTCSSTIKTTTTRSTTELQMGLRSFLKKKVLRRKDDEPGKDSSSSSSAKSNAKNTSNRPANGKKLPNASSQKKSLPSPAAAATPKKVRMGEDPATGEIDVEASKLGPETVQERIRRIKRGDMSAAEKEAFLQSALSTGNTPESRLPMLGRSSDSSSAPQQSASPFPTDSILRDMARGNKKNGTDTTSSSARGGRRDPSASVRTVMDSQSQKRKYLDMVTDPHRFDNYQNQKKSSTGSSGGEEDDSEDGNDESVEAQQQQAPNLPHDLGARLGAHAMETEKRNKEIRKRQEEKERQMEQQRRAREQRLAQAQQARQEEMAKREAELIQRRRAQDQEVAKNQQQDKLAEDARRAELMKAQDDYWAKKLAETKQAEEAKEAAAKAREEEEQRQEEEKRAAAAEAAATAAEEDGEDGTSNVNTLESLNDVVQTRGAQGNNRAAFGRSSLNDLPLRGPSDQDRRQADAADEQLQALRSLNSPLPKPAAGGQTKRTLRKPPAFQPQKPVSARSQTPAQSLGDLTNTIKNPTRTNGQSAPTNETPAAPEPAPPSPPKEERGGNKGSSFNPFSRLGGGGRNSKPSTPSPAPAPAPKAPARKGPIRMELPLGDDDDEEPAMTEGMTIGEIMKRQNAASTGDQEKRSKQWGVDMSRFQE